MKYSKILDFLEETPADWQSISELLVTGVYFFHEYHNAVPSR